MLLGPFGEPFIAPTGGAAELPFRFSTKYQDSETGLTYYGGRYYDAPRGRWLSKDPIEERGGENLYAFCFNSPTRYIDDLGFKPQGPDYVHIVDADPSQAGAGAGFVGTNPGLWRVKISDLKGCPFVGTQPCNWFFKVESKNLTISYAAVGYSVWHEDQHATDAVGQFDEWIAKIESLGKCDCRPKVECRKKVAESADLKWIYYFRWQIQSAQLDLNLDNRPGRIPGNHAGPQAEETRRKLENATRLLNQKIEAVKTELKKCDQLQCPPVPQ